MYLAGQLRVPLVPLSTLRAETAHPDVADAELIRRVVRRDDRDAFGVLVARHQSAVRAFLRQLCRGKAAEADDLAQETFVIAYRRLADFRKASTFKTWLFGIAHNQHRNLRRRQFTAAAATAVHGPGEDIEPSTRTSDLQHDLAHAMNHLSEDERTVVHLHYHEGLSHQEISDALSWPLGTIKTLLARAKERLRSQLGAWKG